MFALVEALHGADADAIHIFAFHAGFSDDVCHADISKVAFWRCGAFGHERRSTNCQASKNWLMRLRDEYFSGFGN
jgi:hypothetical protein